MKVQNNRAQELNQRKKLFDKVHPYGLSKANELQNIKTKMMEQMEKIKVLNEATTKVKVKSGDQSMNIKSGDLSMTSMMSEEK